MADSMLPSLGPSTPSTRRSTRCPLYAGNMVQCPKKSRGGFRAHKIYVEAFCWLAGKKVFTSNRAALDIVASTAAAAGLKDKRPSAIDYNQVHKSLRNAWSTEVLLALPGEWAKDEDEFIRLSNTWGVVQAYYVGYHATQALIVSKGRQRPTSHLQTQQQYASLWADRPLACPPWTLGAADGGLRNKPPAVTIDGAVHPWSNCSAANCWSLAAKALKTTRDEVVRKALDDKREEGRRRRKKDWETLEAERLAKGHKPRVPPTFRRPQQTVLEKAGCDKRTRTYTVLDYLYRLRIGSNYDDASVFTDGPDNDADSYLLHKRISFLASGLALMSELRIRDLVGAGRFHRWAEDFVSNNIPLRYSVGVKERRSLL